MLETDGLLEALNEVQQKIFDQNALWDGLWKLSASDLIAKSKRAAADGHEFDVDIFHMVRSSLLHEAARSDRVDYIAALVGCGANIEATSTSMMTPLAASIEAGSISAFDLLLSLDASIDAPKQGGMTMMHRAAQSGAAWASAKLIEKGADQHAVLGTQLKNRRGLKPAHLAAPHADVLRVMISAGWDMDVRDKDGRNVAHHVVSSDAPASMLLLLESGLVSPTPDNRALSARAMSQGRQGRVEDLLRSFAAAEAAREAVSGLALGQP